MFGILLFLACIAPILFFIFLAEWAKNRSKKKSLLEEKSLNKKLIVISILILLTSISLICINAPGYSNVFVESQTALSIFLGISALVSLFYAAIFLTRVREGVMRCPSCNKAYEGNYKKAPYKVVVDNKKGGFFEIHKTEVACSYCGFSWEKEYESTTLIKEPQDQIPTYKHQRSNTMSDTMISKEQLEELRERQKINLENTIGKHKEDLEKTLSDRYGKDNARKIVEDYPKLNFPPVPKVEIPPMPPMLEIKPLPKIEPFDPDKYR